MKKLFVFLLLGVFMISFVSAMDFDNVKPEQSVTFDGKKVLGNQLLEKYKPIKIINALGLGRTLFEGYLSQHDDVCGIECKSTMEINLHDDEILIDDVIFKTLQDDGDWEEQDVRSYKFMYWGDIKNYESICSFGEQVVYGNGTTYTPQTCESILVGSDKGWINYQLGTIMPEGIYTVRLEAWKKPSRTVDWIIKTNGEWLEGWATWGNISLGDDAEVILNSPIDNFVLLTPISEVEFNCSANVTGGASLVNMSLWTNETGSWELRNSTESIGGDISYSGLVNYYTLDSATDPIKDFVEFNQLNLTPINSPTATAGKIDNALTLDGSNQYANTTNTLIDKDKNYSISVWINADDITQSDFVMGMFRDGGDRMAMGLVNSKIVFQTFTGVSQSVSSTTLLSSTWYHVLVNHYGNNYSKEMWVNGIKQSGSESIGNPGSHAEVLHIGQRENDVGFWDGRIDELAFFDKTLTDADAITFYNSGNGFRPESGNTSSTQTWNRTITDTTLWSCQAYDSDNDSSFATENRTLDIDATVPQISVENPNGTLGYNFIGGNEALNVTFTDANLEECWFNYNGTNITIDGCQTGVKNSTQFILELNNLNMTLYANDSVGNLNSTFINWSYNYLEINRTHNETSFETAGEIFSINVEGPTSATLFYNGTEYTTTKSGNDFTRTIQMIAGQLGNHSVFWRFDNTQDSRKTYQIVSETVFTLCNATYDITFLNISFKDESDLSVINASIPTSTFVFWLGDGTVTKTLTFINTSVNFNYEFCATPNRTFNFNTLLQYKQGSAYPQRVFSQDGGTLTNITTDLTLYLLGVSDGLFVTFQVLNVAEQGISDVDISATRVLEGSPTPVAQGTTDAAGSVTFWLNPDFQHTITFEKTGLDTEILTIFPTQTAYTISMGGGTVTEPDQTRGVSLVVKPQISFLFNDTTYNFNYTVSSTFWNLEQFGYTLIYSNGTIIDTQLSTATSGGVLSTSANTFNLSWIRMDYHYLINTTFTNASRIWYIQTTEGTEYSISNFFERLIFYIDAGIFGFDDFGKALISFLVLVLVAGGLSFRYGINSEVAIMGIIFGLVLVLDVGLGLIPNPQLATQAGLKNIVTIITGIILFGFLAKEELR